MFDSLCYEDVAKWWVFGHIFKIAGICWCIKDDLLEKFKFQAVEENHKVVEYFVCWNSGLVGSVARWSPYYLYYSIDSWLEALIACC